MDMKRLVKGLFAKKLRGSEARFTTPAVSLNSHPLA